MLWEQKMNTTLMESQLERIRKLSEANVTKLQNTIRELCIRETKVKSKT